MQTDIAPDHPDARTERCELCVIGAGIAGLNAIWAASRYLSPHDRVVLVDRNASAGGMWHETYDYVRLHQPHRMFTAGDIGWTIARPPSYLASKTEVLEHFRHCITELRSRVDLVEYYGYAYREHREVPSGHGYEVEIRCRDESSGGGELVLRANRCIKAFGYNVPVNPPLEFSSTEVDSVSPHGAHLLEGTMGDSNRPVYIIGGGKTGMDTAHALIERCPGREVNLVVGRGTMFMNRSTAFRSGPGRWFGGRTSLMTFLDLCLQFTGDNTDQMVDYFRRRCAVALGDDFDQYMFGILSEQENAAIAAGCREVISDYVRDIVDDGGETRMVFRSGKTRPIERRSLVVNCTGYIGRKPIEYEPYLSEHGAVISIQPTSSIHFLSTFGSYFLTHLFYLDRLGRLPLYELDGHTLMQKDKTILPFASITQTLYNAMMIIDNVPVKVLSECGLDFDRWYPLYRRILAAIHLRRNRPRYAAQFKRALDKVQAKYGIHCGVLPQVAAAGANTKPANRRTAL